MLPLLAVGKPMSMVVSLQTLDPASGEPDGSPPIKITVGISDKDKRADGTYVLSFKGVPGVLSMVRLLSSPQGGDLFVGNLLLLN